MAPKRNSLLEVPPAASSDDEEMGSDEEEEDEEEEEGQGDEGEEMDSDDDDNKSDSDELDKSPKKLDPSVPKSQSHSSSDDDEDEESDSDDLDKSPPKLKPSEPHRSSNPSIVKTVKSIHDSPKPKKTVTKPAASTAISAPVKPVSTAASKRPLESDKAEKDSKRKKKKVGGGDDDDEEAEDDDHPEEGEKPKNIFQRLWSDEDEIVILKHMSDCKKEGFDASSDIQEFLDAIKKSLHVNVSRDQLTNKIRRLKKKFQNNFKRGKSGGDPAFSKPHDVRSYELMKEIWGEQEAKSRKSAETSDGGNDDSALTNGKRSRSTKSRAALSPKPKTVALNDISHKEQPKLEAKNWSVYPCLNESLQLDKSLTTVGESLMKEGLGLLGDSKAKELEQKWRKLQAAELEVYIKRVELVREQTMAVLKALNSSDS